MFRIRGCVVLTLAFSTALKYRDGVTFRSFISFLMVLILGLTSQAMAVTRGAAAATGQVVICNGSGTMVLYLDAEGQPTAAPHICPDCALSDGAGVTPAAALAPWAVLYHGQALLVKPYTVIAPVTQIPQCRAPPLPV